MNHDKRIDDFIKHLEKISESDQFWYSNYLIDKRYEMELPFEKMAEIAGLTPNEYINFEYGDTDIPVKNYQEVIEKIKKYEVKK